MPGDQILGGLRVEAVAAAQICDAMQLFLNKFGHSRLIKDSLVKNDFARTITPKLVYDFPLRVRRKLRNKELAGRTVGARKPPSLIEQDAGDIVVRIL